MSTDRTDGPEHSRKARFALGEIVKHRKYPFRGIIFDVDPVFANTDEWWLSIPEDVRPTKEQPFYHLLAENAETEYIAYVSEQNLLKIMNEVSMLDAHDDAFNVLALDDPQLMKYPLIYLIEVGWWTLSESEAAGLRAYLQKGGFLIIDDFHYENEWAVFERAMKKVLPAARIDRRKDDVPDRLARAAAALAWRDGQALALVMEQRVALAQHPGRGHGHLGGGQLGGEGVFFQDLRIAPAARAIELGDGNATVLQVHLQHPVLVGVQLQQPAVGLEAGQEQRLQHAGGVQRGVGGVVHRGMVRPAALTRWCCAAPGPGCP